MVSVAEGCERGFSYFDERGEVLMYSGWIITIGKTSEKKIIWGEESKVDEFKKANLENADFGGGFTGRTLEEIKSIVVTLKTNHPNAEEITL